MEQIANYIVIALEIIIPLSILLGIACIALMASIKLDDLQDYIQRMER